MIYVFNSTCALLNVYIGLTKDYPDLLLWVELCSSKVHMLKSYTPIPQNVTWVEDKVFKELFMLKWGLYGGL